MMRDINIYQLMLLPVIFMLVACDDSPQPLADMQIRDRSVATTYKVKSENETDQVRCYRIQGSEMSEMTLLNNNQFVEIVSVEEGLRRFQGDLWLHIYPRLTHRPGCYVNVNNLIPYS